MKVISYIFGELIQKCLHYFVPSKKNDALKVLRRMTILMYIEGVNPKCVAGDIYYLSGDKLYKHPGECICDAPDVVDYHITIDKKRVFLIKKRLVVFLTLGQDEIRETIWEPDTNIIFSAISLLGEKAALICEDNVFICWHEERTVWCKSQEHMLPGINKPEEVFFSPCEEYIIIKQGGYIFFNKFWQEVKNLLVRDSVIGLEYPSEPYKFAVFSSQYCGIWAKKGGEFLYGEEINDVAGAKWAEAHGTRLLVQCGEKEIFAIEEEKPSIWHWIYARKWVRNHWISHNSPILNFAPLNLNQVAVLDSSYITIYEGSSFISTKELPNPCSPVKDLNIVGDKLVIIFNGCFYIDKIVYKLVRRKRGWIGKIDEEILLNSPQ